MSIEKGLGVAVVQELLRLGMGQLFLLVGSFVDSMQLQLLLIKLEQ